MNDGQDEGNGASPPPDDPPRSRRGRRASGQPRAVTISIKHRRDILGNEDTSIVDEIGRPAILADCEAGGSNEERPCPYVGCKHHLYLDINPDTGSIKINFPDKEPWEIPETCSIDVAERGGITLEEVGVFTNLTRERVRQVEVKGLIKLRMMSPESTGTHDYRHPDPSAPPPVAPRVRRRRKKPPDTPQE